MVDDQSAGNGVMAANGSVDGNINVMHAGVGFPSKSRVIQYLKERKLKESKIHWVGHGRHILQCGLYHYLEYFLLYMINFVIQILMDHYVKPAN